MIDSPEPCLEKATFENLLTIGERGQLAVAVVFSDEFVLHFYFHTITQPIVFELVVSLEISCTGM